MWAIELYDQPLTILKDNAFVNFTDLYAIAISFGSLSVIERNAFNGVERSLKELRIRNNRLSKIEAGSLDRLVALRVLDIRNNAGEDATSTYTTAAWHLCHRIVDEDLRVDGNLTFLQNYERQTEARPFAFLIRPDNAPQIRSFQFGPQGNKKIIFFKYCEPIIQ